MWTQSIGKTRKKSSTSIQPRSTRYIYTSRKPEMHHVSQSLYSRDIKSSTKGSRQKPVNDQDGRKATQKDRHQAHKIASEDEKITPQTGKKKHEDSDPTHGIRTRLATCGSMGVGGRCSNFRILGFREHASWCIGIRAVRRSARGNIVGLGARRCWCVEVGKEGGG